MIGRPRPTPSARRHRGGRRSALAWLLAPGHRAAAAALGATVVLVGAILAGGLVGSSGSFAPPTTGSGDGTRVRGESGARQGGAPPSSAGSGPAAISDTSSPSPTGAGTESPDASPTPSDSSSTPTGSTSLDPSVTLPVKHESHHGKPSWAGGGQTQAP